MDRRHKLLQYKVNNTVIDIRAVVFGSFKTFPQRFRSLIWVYVSWINKDRMAEQFYRQVRESDCVVLLLQMQRNRFKKIQLGCLKCAQLSNLMIE